MLNKKNVQTHILMLVCLTTALAIYALFEYEACNSILMIRALLENPSVFLLGFIALVISFLSQRTILPYCVPIEYLVAYFIGDIFGIVYSYGGDGALGHMGYNPLLNLLSPNSIWTGSYFLMLIITLIVDIVIAKRRDEVPKSLWRDNN